MIKIRRSNKADSRTCDPTKVTLEEFENDIYSHRSDVSVGMEYFAKQIQNAGGCHDFTKISKIDDFYRDFKTGFKTTEWYNMHQKVERHHFENLENIQDDVNLIDVFEHIVDCVMAGMARSGVYRQDKLPFGLLEKAYDNTIKMLLCKVEVEDESSK